MNILIIGGYGFIGYRIAKFLKSKRNTVILSSSKKKIINDKNFSIIRIRYKDYEEIKKLNKNIDAIIYCAGIGANQSEENYELAKRINAAMAEDLAKLSIKLNIKKFIYFSTIHVYSSMLSKDYKENADLLNKHPYAKTNQLAEKNLKKISLNSLNTLFLILRLSNAFGYPVTLKSNSWKLLINEMVKKLIKNKCFNLRSSGHQKRDFIPVSELCNVVYFFLNKKNKKNKNYDIFNISTGRSLSIRKVSSVIKKLLESKSKTKFNISFKNFKENENIYDYTINNNKLIKSGYKFKYTFKQELEKLYFFCKKNFK